VKGRLASRMQVSIRPARVEDAPALARIHVASWRSAYTDVVPKSYLDQLDVPQRQARWSRILRERESKTFVAETMAGVVGFVSVGKAREWAGPGTGELYALYVAEEHKRRGVGTRLFHAGVESLDADDHHGMMLWVFAKDPSGRAFYEKLGGVAGPTKVEELSGVAVEEVSYVWAQLPGQG